MCVPGFTWFMSLRILAQLARWLGIAIGDTRSGDAQLKEMLQSRANSTSFLSYLNHKKRDLIVLLKSSKRKEDKIRVLKRIKKLTALISTQLGIFEKIEAGIDTLVMAKTCAEGLAGMEAANAVLADTTDLLSRVEEVHDQLTIGADDVAEICAILSTPLDQSQEFDEDDLLAELEETDYLGSTSNLEEELPDAPTQDPVHAPRGGHRNLSRGISSDTDIHTLLEAAD